jgi:hypothetical protein
MSKSSIDNCREWGTVQIGRKFFGPDPVTKGRRGFTDRRQKDGLSSTVHPQPQRITEVRGKPRSCHA